MKSPLALSLLFLIPSIRAVALPQLVGDELESSSSPLKRETGGDLTPRSPQPGLPEREYKGSKREVLPEAVAAMTDDPSLDPSLNLKRDLSSRNPQGPDSNPGEFIDVVASRENPANHGTGAHHGTPGGFDYAGRVSKMEHGSEMEHHRHHNKSGTHHGHRKEGILAEFNSHGEHIVVYNGTHYPNGTRYSPANETIHGAKVVDEVVIAGDEVVVYRGGAMPSGVAMPSGGAMPSGTGVWLPSGTGWILRGTGTPYHHRKRPSTDYAGFRGPKWNRYGDY